VSFILIVSARRRKVGAILRFVSRAIGVALIAAAFMQWLTFDYPDINPFWPGAIFV
jgi:hypothetical protein